MSVLQDRAIEQLSEARTELIGIPKQDLSYAQLARWRDKWSGPILAAGQVAGSQAGAWNPVRQELDGRAHESNVDVLDAMRENVVASLDATMAAVDSRHIVRPVLEELILRVKDTKLATMLREFNASKDQQPNFAAIGFRTVIALVLIEIAKLKNPGGRLAASDDFRLDAIIKEALAESILDGGDVRLLERFRDGPKTLLDVVAHKPGAKSLVGKDNLSASVDSLLNQLLKTLTSLT
jgi:hypothetical protein